MREKRKAGKSELRKTEGKSRRGRGRRRKIERLHTDFLKRPCGFIRYDQFALYRDLTIGGNVRTYETIVIERQDEVAIVELNKPGSGNALDELMAEELADVVSVLEADEQTRSLILTGTGRFFCGGGDLKAMSAFGDAVEKRVKRMADNVHRAISGLARMPVPVIIAVNGVAAGGGFGLAMAGDLVLASEKASFTMSYLQAGLTPDGSSTFFLPRQIGLRKLQELLFTNRSLSAQEAMEWGLVTKIVPDEKLREAALELANSFDVSSRQAIGAMKGLLLSSGNQGLETQMELEGRAIAQSAASDTGRDRIRAFVDRRK